MLTTETVYTGNESRIIRVFDHVYFRLSNLDIRHQCNIGIIELPSSIALVDYTVQQPDEELLDEAESILRKPVKYIFITHAHRDHADGLKTLRRKDITAIAGASCFQELHKAYAGLVPDCTIPVTENGALELEGVTFRLELPETTAHSPWDMLVGLPEYACVFTGDALVLRKYMFFQSSFISSWKDFLASLKTGTWAYFLMGHGEIAQKDYLDEAISHLSKLEEVKKLMAPYAAELSDGLEGLRSADPKFKAAVKGLLVDGIVPGLPDKLREFEGTVGMEVAARQALQLALRTVKGY